MRRSVLIGSALVVLAVLALAVLGATRTTRTAFTTAVVPDIQTVTVERDGLVCQNVAAVRARFDRVAIPLDVAGGRGQRPAIDVQVRDAAGTVVARGRVEPGWVSFPGALTVARLDRPVPPPGAVDVCLLNDGRRAFSVWGSPADRYPGAQAIREDGQPAGSRLTLGFQMPQTTRLAQLSDVLERMTLFRAAWVGPWLGWVLVGLVLLALPALLVAALRSAARRGN